MFGFSFFDKLEVMWRLNTAKVEYIYYETGQQNSIALTCVWVNLTFGPVVVLLATLYCVTFDL